jgi:hypothetical protein
LASFWLFLAAEVPAVHQINVNGLARSAASASQNWGQLLDLLESGDGQARQLVTAVRFGGVAVPTFREPQALTRELQSLGSIDVETATVDELLHESAHAAFDSIEPLRRAAIRTASRLRSGDEKAATRHLTDLTSSIQTLTTVTVVLSRARACGEPHRADLDGLVVRFCRIVDAMTNDRVNGAWQSLADALERELAPTLEAWGLVARRVWRMD